MRARGAFTAVGIGITMGALVLFGQRAQTASALPTFAQAYGVDCSACHSMVPALNAYGRYIQSTAYGGLDADVMKKAIPVVVRETMNYRSTGKLNRTAPNDKFTELSLSLYLVGRLDKTVSYRFEQALYSNNLSGGNLSHAWVAYNNLFAGNAHLVVGKFDVPAPAPFSYWGDLSGFSSGSIGVGQHTYNTGTRWGARFNYVPTNYAHRPYKLELAYVGNASIMPDATVFGNAPGSDKALMYKAAWARPDNPVEVGIWGSNGSYQLGSGFVNPVDNYNALGVYAQRDPLHGFPGLFAFYQRTNDSNIGPGRASQQLVQGASSWAYAVELDQPLFHGNVMLGIRPVEYTGGLQNSRSGLATLGTAKPHYGVFDIFYRNPKLSPYLYMAVESAVSNASNAANGLPTWRASVRWASPIGPVSK